MHTGYVPNPNIEYPSYGSVVAHELAPKVPELEVPPFVSVGGGSEGPGFLGMTWAPFVVNSNGDVRDMNMGIDQNRTMQRMAMWRDRDRFRRSDRGAAEGRKGTPVVTAASEHAKILDKTYS